MSLNPGWPQRLAGVLDMLAEEQPRDLWAFLQPLGLRDLTGTDVCLHLRSASINDKLRTSLHAALAAWDAHTGSDWEPQESTAPLTGQRRDAVYRRLGFGPELVDVCNQLYRVYTDRTTVISKTFEPWYDTARSSRSSMYWEHYACYLRDVRSWPIESIYTLDCASTAVVERLSDPCRRAAKQTRGLVVGYVQSGKTANFTGVAAKAIDAGYRLVIVLTGTVEILRSQTQRRMDMELVGTENIIAGQDLDSPEVRRQLDYQQDRDWIEGRFVTHGDPLRLGHAVRIRRITTHQSDYKTLPQGLNQLRYYRRNAQAPLNDPENLFATEAYVAVVKKNGAPLRKLINDLKPLKATLDDLPVLIIDDEADQASVDTTNPSRSNSRSARKRTAINGLISQLMGLCKRAQYVGYTATPFANVFIDPDDDSDLFPTDFLLSLPRPPEYMGVQEFHDVGRRWDGEERNPHNSNEKAHVRSLTGGEDQDPDRRDAELLQAMDAFVLSGALKDYREKHGQRHFRHHTMLVHESMYTGAHGDTAQDVRRLWAQAAFTSGRGLQRLEQLWIDDFAPVCRARANGEVFPDSFGPLRMHVAEAVARITIDEDPVIVVNSDKELTANQKRLDFQTDRVWRILVGGNQLSRGFTVEDLTVSYFRRKAGQGDTLMQAGRWFGFRPGYADLVRLYIRRDEEVDLYAAFEALLLDEESFREELAQYSGFDEDGMPILEPRQIPPLVSQHLPWLRPTARNKMWNAIIEQKATANRPRDLYGLPERGSDDLGHNAIHVGTALAAAASRKVELTAERIEGEQAVQRQFTSRVGTLGAETVVGLLRKLLWHPGFQESIQPTLRFIAEATSSGRITEWVVLWPQLAKVTTTAELAGARVQVIKRARRGGGRLDFVGSDRMHASALRDVSEGAQGELPPSTSRGALLMYFVDDRDEAEQDHSEPNVDNNEVALLLTLYLPPDSTPTRRDLIKWTVRNRNQEDAVTVDKPSEPRGHA